LVKNDYDTANMFHSSYWYYKKSRGLNAL
jgi:hypothetical protein